MNQNERRIILEVPFVEKNQAKELGAWWDPEIKKWFVPAGRDPRPFRQWFINKEAEPSSQESSA